MEKTQIKDGVNGSRNEGRTIRPHSKHIQ